MIETLMNNDLALMERRSYDDTTLSILNDIYVEQGTKDDWELLHELHYKASGVGPGPRYWKATLDGRTIGVSVICVPRVLDSGRHEVFPELSPKDVKNKLINQHRMKWINQNMALSSRVVVDTVYRGAGLAYRLRNLAFRMSGKKFIESRSSMSRFNPFGQKSGTKYVAPRESQHYESGLIFFSRYFKSVPHDYSAIVEELSEMRSEVREGTLTAMREWYFKHSALEKSGSNRHNGTSRVDALPVFELVKQVQQLVFGVSLYGVYENPDFGRDLPDRLPLLAFDRQKPNEPLII